MNIAYGIPFTSAADSDPCMKKIHNVTSSESVVVGPRKLHFVRYNALIKRLENSSPHQLPSYTLSTR